MAEPARLFRLLLRRPSEEEIERRELLYAIKTRVSSSAARAYHLTTYPTRIWSTQPYMK